MTAVQAPDRNGRHVRARQPAWDTVVWNVIETGVAIAYDTPADHGYRRQDASNSLRASLQRSARQPRPERDGHAVAGRPHHCTHRSLSVERRPLL